MCTSIAVGKKATCDNVILISRNEDCLRANWNKYLVYRDAPEYIQYPNTVQDGQWILGNGLTVPVPQNGYCYSGMPDAGSYAEASNAIGDRFFFEERGINEQNFAISATNSLEINKKANAADPLLAKGGIAESVIPTLILPQAKSAQHAIELLGGYVETAGASEANGILLADPDESWYFEIGSGHHWIAVKIPKDSYIAVANGMRVHAVDITDMENVRCSPNLVEFVADHRLLDDFDPQNFNFAKAFGVLGDPKNVDRIWLAQSILTPSLHQEVRQIQYPLFLKPDALVGVQDVMKVLTATYKGTVLEGKAERSIGWDKTAESHIITLNSGLPDMLCGMIWQAVSTPLCAPYMPLYRAMNTIPPGFSKGGNEYSSTSAYWAFRGLYFLAKDQDEETLDGVRKMWRDNVAQFVEEHPFIEKMVMEMNEQSPASAADFLSRYSTGIAYEAVAKANDERNKLMTKVAQKSD
jgi:dipeptidase